MTYSGTNPTAKQSKELLADALAQLISTKKYTQISIKEVCEKAQVSRQTFYNLFDSKDDILRYYLEATMKTMFASLWQKQDQSPEHLISVTVRYVETNRLFLRLLVENSLQSMFLQAIQAGITELTKDETTEYSEFRKAFIAGGLTQAIIQWIYEPQNVKAAEFSEMLSEMIKILQEKL